MQQNVSVETVSTICVPTTLEELDQAETIDTLGRLGLSAQGMQEAREQVGKSISLT